VGRGIPSTSAIIASALALTLLVINVLIDRNTSLYWYVVVIPIGATWVLLSRQVARRVAADRAHVGVKAPSYRRTILAFALVLLWAVIIVVALNLWLPFPGAAVPSILILAVVVTVGISRVLAARGRRQG